MSIDVSIVMPYWNRLEQLKVALESYSYWYAHLKDRVELIIMVDGDANDAQALKEIVGPRSHHHVLVMPGWMCDPSRRTRVYRNPNMLMNFGVDYARGELILLTNADIAHMGNIIEDAQFAHFLGGAVPHYRVYSVRERDTPVQRYRELLDDPMGSAGYWCQHPRYNNPLLHFCSVIPKALFREVGGFGTEYGDGIGFEDNDFVEKLLEAGVEIVAVEEPMAMHLYHDRTYQRGPDGRNVPEWYRNHDIFRARWGHGPRLFTPDCKTGRPWM